jgi:cob(II)yrinic acid a,c-diamide reductase
MNWSGMSGEFSLTILTADQGNLSDRFAGKIADVIDRFEGVETEKLLLEAPLIKGGMAHFNCRVVNTFPVGENTLFVAEVVAAQGEGEGDPLVYHNRVFWKLTK